MGKHIVISDEARKKLEKIKLMRPQDTSMAQTIDHLIYIYEEQQFKPKMVIAGAPMMLKEKLHIIPGNASSPIIDADQLQVVRNKP